MGRRTQSYLRTKPDTRQFSVHQWRTATMLKANLFTPNAALESPKRDPLLRAQESLKGSSVKQVSTYAIVVLTRSIGRPPRHTHLRAKAAVGRRCREVCDAVQLEGFVARRPPDQQPRDGQHDAHEGIALRRRERWILHIAQALRIANYE